MSADSIISIVIILLIIYIFVKFVLKPILKAILGIILFLVVIYTIQHILGISLKPILGPLSDLLDIEKWTWANWIFAPIKNILNFIKSLAQKLHVSN